MNKPWKNIILVQLIFICCIQFACWFDSNSINREYENNWIDCYNDHLIFEEDSTILPGDYVKCELNGRNILINSLNSQFEGSRLFTTSGSSSIPDIHFPNTNKTRNRIRLAFIDYTNYLTQFSLVLDYSPDSINYLIQKIFSNPNLYCSTNLENREIEFVIGTFCSTGVSIEFSTFYSEMEIQKINIDSFAYKCYDNKCYYHLEYSADELEVTNSSWNSRSNYNHGDINMKSKLLIENLPVNDLKVVIDFNIQMD